MNRRGRVLVALTVIGTVIGAGGCASTSDTAMRESVRAVRAPVGVPPTPTATTAPPPIAATARRASRPTPRSRRARPWPTSRSAGSSSSASMSTPSSSDTGTTAPGRWRGSTSTWCAPSHALFGDLSDEEIDQKIDYRAVTTAQRLPSLQQHQVDLVASLVTVTCRRRELVGLSSVYYRAHQRVLVRDESDIRSVDDLANRRVCATSPSTTIDQIRARVPAAELYPVSTRTDCLVALQDGTVDAITADDTILLGFHAEDPKTLLLDEQISDEPYGIAVQIEHPEFVRFVNSVLEQMRADGSLQALYEHWLGDGAPEVPAVTEYRP